jgi:hypothetical protein
MIYVLVSGTFEMLDTPHKGEVLGQQFDLTDDQAKSAILAGACLLPQDAFDDFGFNSEELKAYSNARRQAAAPAIFHAKHSAAVLAASGFRAQLAAGAGLTNSKLTEVKA